MSFFPHTLLTCQPSAFPSSSFHPLFRLLDDFDTYSRGPNAHSGSAVFKAFTPKFDVKDETEAYELHGELPGIDQKDINIEFTDEYTLTIKGRTERSSSSSSSSIEDVQGNDKTEKQSISASHQTTVEDGNGQGEEDSSATEACEKNDSSTSSTREVALTPKNAAEVAKPKARYWVSERGVGEFSRSFTFPSRVDQEKVTASMKNGVLNIVVPKAKKTESRKITIS